MESRERITEPRKIVMIIPAKASGDQYNTNILILPDGTKEIRVSVEKVPATRETNAVTVTVLPDGKLISSAAEAAANECVVELLIRYGLTPADVYIRYESNAGYINLLWWGVINRLWCQKTSEIEKPKKSRKKKEVTE